MVSSGWNCAAWSKGEQAKVLQLVIVSVCWLFLQIEGGSPGTTAVLFTLAVYLVPTKRRRPSRRPLKSFWPDALSSAENGDSARSREIAANLLLTGELEAFLDKSCDGVRRQAPGTSTQESAPAAATPNNIASIAQGNPFEEALTRLAGAASTCGTEPLIYVRRADVAVIVDALMDVVRTPAGPTVTSPAFARLNLVRRSGRKDPRGGRRALSPVRRGERAALAFHRDRPGRGGGGGGGEDSSGRRAVSASPSLSRGAPTIAPSGGKALFQDSNMTTPPRVLARPSPASTKITFRPRSPPPPSPSGEGEPVGNSTVGARRIRGGMEGRQHRVLQRVHSPRAFSMTPIALAKNNEAPLSAAGASGTSGGKGGSQSGVMRSTVEKKQTKLKPPALITTMMHDGCDVTPCSTASDRKKIRCVPARGEGSDFDDFWSSGWG
ncbi:unnamed protein product [Ectocarpus sp. 12 AP-2014]